MNVFRFLAGLALAGALVAGCGRRNEASTDAASRPLHLAFVTNNAGDFWELARNGTEDATRHLRNVTVDFLIPAEATPADQQQIIDDLLKKRVDGIAVSPIDPGSQTQMIDEAAAQTLVFTQDSDAPASNRACYIGTDNTEAGRRAGELLKQALPKGGKVMVFVGSIEVQNARERLSGIEEVLQGSRIQILGVRTDDTDRVRARLNVAETLAKVPDIAGLVGLWSYNGPAAVRALREAGKIGRVKVVCFDQEDETLEGVKSGAIFATVAQQPYEFGRLAIIDMAKYLRGDPSVVPEGRKIIIPALAIDRSKVDEFTARTNEMRGRDSGLRAATPKP